LEEKLELILCDVESPVGACCRGHFGPKPDIVISDYRLLAGETGFQVAQSVGAAFDNALPAIITTGDTNPNLMREIARHGIVIHYKPLQMEKLLSTVNEATKLSTL
jgi:DNA-binding NtrC family response regulator